MLTRNRCFPNTGNLFKKYKSAILLAVLICYSAFGKDRFYEPAGLPLSRDFLRLPENRWIWLKKVDEHKTKIIFGKKIKNSRGKLINKVIWSEECEEKYDALWDYAYF